MKPAPPLLDNYGHVVDPARPRHDKCGCTPSCQRAFRCRSRHHSGDRQTPYCFGGEGESCNDCWWLEQLRQSKLRKKKIQVMSVEIFLDTRP